MINKKLFAVIALVPFLLNGPVSAQQTPVSYEYKVEAKKVDDRSLIVKRYLAKYNSPLQYQAQDFIDASDTYNIDWRLLVAIAGVESTFGKFLPYESHNAWGWGIYGNNSLGFKSWREGIFTVAEGLSKNYLAKGYTTPEIINKKYSSSPKWAGNVNYFLNDIAEFETHYQPDPNVVELANVPSFAPMPTAGYSAGLASR